MLLACLPLLGQEVAFTGLPSPQALAVTPRGTVFAVLEGGLAQIHGSKSFRVLSAEARGAAAVAVDADGNFYAALPGAGNAVRVTPWGETTPVPGACGGQAVAVGRAGEVYTTDGTRICVTDRNGRGRELARGFAGITALLAAGDLFVAAPSAVWRLSPDGKRRRRAADLGQARVSALALDEQGRLYAAASGTGQVLMFDSAGRPAGQHQLKESSLTGMAFGGLDLNLLLVSGSSGAVHRIRTPARASLQVWESDAPLRILEPIDGTILNRHDGSEILVKGVCRRGAAVRVNGRQTPVRDGRFEARLPLTQRETRVTAEAAGGLRDEVKVFWDRKSFPRYRVSTDDNIWFFRDIARNADRYSSIFDNPYLAMWKYFHDKYGAKVHHNIYYETDGFNLSQMPDKYRQEWRRNASWMRLSFHARANEPDRPYLHSSAGRIREDYRQVVSEIERFAGKEVLHPVTTVHWGETTLAAAKALRAEGIRTLVGYFEAPADVPRVSYYLRLDQLRHMLARDYWIDTRQDIRFVRHDIVINTIPLEKIDAHLDRVASDPHQAEVMELMIHEQYFYPDYVAYERDYRQRVERAIQWVTHRGYKPVFYEDGFLGAPED